MSYCLSLYIAYTFGRMLYIQYQEWLGDDTLSIKVYILDQFFNNSYLTFTAIYRKQMLILIINELKIYFWKSSLILSHVDLNRNFNSFSMQSSFSTPRLHFRNFYCDYINPHKAKETNIPFIFIPGFYSIFKMYFYLFHKS